MTFTASANSFNSRLREEATNLKLLWTVLVKVSTHASVRRRPQGIPHMVREPEVSTHASVRRRLAVKKLLKPSSVVSTHASVRRRLVTS